MSASTPTTIIPGRPEGLPHEILEGVLDIATFEGARYMLAKIFSEIWRAVKGAGAQATAEVIVAKAKKTFLAERAGAVTFINYNLRINDGPAYANFMSWVNRRQ